MERTSAWRCRRRGAPFQVSRVRAVIHEQNGLTWRFKNPYKVEYLYRFKAKAEVKAGEGWRFKGRQFSKGVWRMCVRKEKGELYIENTLKDYVHRGRRLAESIKTLDFSFILREFADVTYQRSFSFLPRETGETEKGVLFSFLLREMAASERGMVFSFLFRECQRTEGDFFFSFLYREAAKQEELVDFSFLIRNMGIWDRMNCLLKEEKGLAERERQPAVESDTKEGVNVQLSELYKEAKTAMEEKGTLLAGELLRLSEEHTPMLEEKEQRSLELSGLELNGLFKALAEGQVCKASIAEKVCGNVACRQEISVVRDKIKGGIAEGSQQLLQKTGQRAAVDVQLVLYGKSKMAALRDRFFRLSLNERLLASDLIEGFVERKTNYRIRSDNLSRRFFIFKQLQSEKSFLMEGDMKPKPVLLQERMLSFTESKEMIAAYFYNLYIRNMQQLSGGEKEQRFVREYTPFQIRNGERRLVKVVSKAVHRLKAAIQASRKEARQVRLELVEYFGKRISPKAASLLSGIFAGELYKKWRQLNVEEDKAADRKIRQENVCTHEEAQGERLNVKELDERLFFDRLLEGMKVKKLGQEDRATALRLNERIYVPEGAKPYDKRCAGVDLEAEHTGELYKRFWTISESGFKDSIILPEVDYPYEQEPIVFGGQVQNNENFNSVYPNEFYRVIDRHPIGKGADIGNVEMAVDMAVFVDMINIFILMWFKYTKAFWGWTGAQAVQGITEGIYEYINLETSRNQQHRRDIRADYDRVFRWMRWEAEKVVLLARDDMELHGNYYVGVMLEELIDYMVDHHFDIMPIFKDVEQMDEWRGLFGKEVENDIAWVLDKVKGIRHKKVGGKNR